MTDNEIEYGGTTNIMTNGQAVEWLSSVHQGHWMSNINQLLAPLGLISQQQYLNHLTSVLFPFVRFSEIVHEKTCGSEQNFTTITYLQKKSNRKSSTLEISN